MRLTALAAFAVLLAGCAGAPERPVPQVERVMVEVRVPVPCEFPPEPLWAVDGLPVGAAIDEQVPALLAERRQAKAYLGELKKLCR